MVFKIIIIGSNPIFSAMWIKKIFKKYLKIFFEKYLIIFLKKYCSKFTINYLIIFFKKHFSFFYIKLTKSFKKIFQIKHQKNYIKNRFIILQKYTYHFIYLSYSALKWSYFPQTLTFLKNFFIKNSNFYYSGVFDFLKKFKLFSISFCISFGLLLLLMYVHLVSLNKIIMFWFFLFLCIYWTFSTFVFFIKKYYWSRFTTANQRFWKRTLILFWILEFFLFFIFLYLTHNANTESVFMLDQIQIFKQFLSPVNYFLLNLSLITFIILYLYLVLLNIKWQNFNKLILFFFFISLLLGFVLFFEGYQFFHLVNYYSNLYWEYDIDAEVWSIEFESRKTRTYHHYTILLGILKFWHIVFIISMWVFFLMRALELRRFRYLTIASNLQNFLFLYIFNWILLFPWIKFFLIYFFTYTYTEFFIHFRNYFFFFFWFDLYSYIGWVFYFDVAWIKTTYNLTCDYLYWIHRFS